MRLISIDTETTGGSAPKGDRCVEIGAVEIIDGRLTGRTFQTYINPERPVAWQAQRVHGLSNRFLADKPLFAEIAPDLLEFIGDAPCMAHNARFDRDMILHDFRAADLQIPELRFYDTIPLAKAKVRAPAYRLDVLARTLGVLDRDRGKHGALEDSEILARVLARIEADQPGALRDWMTRSAALSPLPKGWGPATRSSGPAPVRRSGEPAAMAGPEEQAEADRIGAILREAVAEMRDFADLATRLCAAGVLLRPVINGGLALHGVRFSTPKASFTGGRIGLTGPALETAGAAYRHAEHEALVARLVEDHDRVMGPVNDLKSRFTAVPLTGGASQNATARDRVCDLVRAALPGARTIFDLADRLEPDGVRVETRIDAKRMRVSSVLLVAEGARVPGGRVGLGPRDMSPEFWSLAPQAPLRAGPDGRVLAPEVRKLAPAPAPTQIGEGLNEGVAELIAAVNSGAMGIGPGTVSRIRCGRDAWSGMPEEALWEFTQELPEEQVGARLAELPETDRGSALRWVCRGMDPDRVVAFHEARAALYEARRSRTESDPAPEP